MTDSKKLAEEVMAKAVLAAGKDAAKRAALDLVSSDEERAARETGEEEQAATGKSRRTKLIVLGVLGLFVVIGVLGLLVSYWYYFLAAGLLGLGAWYARWRWRRWRAAKAKGDDAAAADAKVSRRAPAEDAQRGDEPAPEQDVPARVADDPAARAAAEALAAAARAEAEAAEAADIEDELAAMKKRLEK